MGDWIYFLHPPRDNFAETMSDDEGRAFAAHADWLRRLLDVGVLILSGPCLGGVNTGIVIFEAPDMETAQRVIADEPVAQGGYMRGELRPFRVAILRGRD